MTGILVYACQQVALNHYRIRQAGVAEMGILVAKQAGFDGKVMDAFQNLTVVVVDLSVTFVG